MNFSGLSMFRKQDRPSLPPAPPVPPAQLAERPATPPYSPKSPVRRKPLPPSATPISFTRTQTPDQSPKQPGLQQVSPPLNTVSQAPENYISPDAQLDFASLGLGLIPRDLDSYYRNFEASPEIAKHPGTANPSYQQKKATLPQEEITIQVQLPTPRVKTASPLSTNHARVASESHLAISQKRNQPSQFRRPASATTMSSSPVSAHHQNPSLHIPFRTHSPSNSEVDDMNKPKSPSRLTSFFRWGSTAEQGGVQPTDWDHVNSPLLSPKSAALPPLPHKGMVPSAIDIPRANSLHSNGFYSDSGISLPPPTPNASAIDEMEEEVRMISADLAASIRREMELEDLIEKLQIEALERSGGSVGKRTSDYFSDAGTPIRNLDSDSKLEYDVEKMMRKADQDKAQIRLEMVSKVQEERQRRKAVESHIRELEEQSGGNSQLLPADAAGRIRDLEVALEEARRRLAEERQMKENYEDLLTALKGQLEEHRNERDNLRDEVVPQLRARVEGLETEASELQKLMYEHSRMQQELANLKNENAALASAMRTQTIRTKNRQSMPPQAYAPIPPSVNSSPITMTNNIILPLNQKERESLAERLKDVEDQRDALHAALRSLRERQVYEDKKAKERIRTLEAERDKAMQQMPRKFGNDKELTALRQEVERLRQRADDVLEQKFMCEKNLATLKMDLEQAEQETSTLRALLQEHDALVTQNVELRASHVRLSQQVSQMKQELAEPRSLSLMQAYKDLQDIHERTLSRLDELEHQGTDLVENLNDRERRLSEAHKDSQRAIDKLRQSVAEAEAERDTAKVEAEAYRKRAESLQKAEKEHLIEERSLATQLRISTERIEELVAQVKIQLESNNTLRDRLAVAVDRGEEEQKVSAQRINELQGKLKQLEDKVLEAQQQTEDAVARHEDEMRRLKESHNSQLRRLKISAMKQPTLFAPKSPLTPLLKSPGLEWTTKHSSSSAAETSIEKMEFLEKRVIELEKALAEADNDMSNVVAQMTRSQIEVVDLHNQRDEAARETRRLYAEVADVKAKFLSFST
ncbi:hypothetical protein RUND412_000774 [Rhizina undulata]